MFAGAPVYMEHLFVRLRDDTIALALRDKNSTTEQ